MRRLHGPTTAKEAHREQNREQMQARTPREAETPLTSFHQPLPNPWDVETWDKLRIEVSELRTGLHGFRIRDF